MYRIATYTICKNELSYVEDWYNSVKLADEIYVLDTGSTDGTLEKFKELEKENSHFHLYEKKYEHFSFADAWNTILEKIPDTIDFVFRIDMDQYIVNKYWPFELRLFLMNIKADPKKTVSIYASMFEKNFSRIESHFVISSRNVRWAGDIHERQYFPGIKRGTIIGYSVPIMIFHNQKYPSTNGTGIPGCQRRFDFYGDIAKYQYQKLNTVFNFIHCVMADGDLNNNIEEFYRYLTGNKEFKKCNSEETYDIEYKPQLVDIATAFIGIATASRAIDEFYYHQETAGKVDMNIEYPYMNKLIEIPRQFLLGDKSPMNKGQFLKDLYSYIEEKYIELSSKLKEFKKEFK